MNIKPSRHTWKVLGAPALAAGIVIFASPSGADAQETADTDLKEGQESSQVEELQELLQERGFLDEEEVHGTFDEDTTAAIKEYQDKHELNEDGIAGPITIGSLEILSEGDEGETVKYLQENLSNLGFYENDIDGNFESNTHDAVVEFQQSQNILVDGLAGPQTFGALAAEIRNNEDTQQTTRQSEDHKEEVAAETNSSSSSEAEGRTLQVSATAYTADCGGCSGVTSTGVDLNANPDAKVIAVDPNVIPLGSKVHIEGYGTYTAADTGGAIHGNKIDVHMPNKSEAHSFGRRNLEVTILD